jgi:aminodeoxyfutalosine synthase
MDNIITKKIENHVRLDKEDALSLFESDDIFQIAELAAKVCNNLNGDRVFYVRNHHINPTNICVNRCKFCAFSRSKGQDGAYEYSISDIIEKLSHKQGIIPSCVQKDNKAARRKRRRRTVMYVEELTTQPTQLDDRTQLGIKEVHIVGGLHPDWSIEYYLDLIRSIKKTFPRLGIKAFTAVEVDYMSKISGMGLEETLRILKGCGLDTMPGGGAEIFNPIVRNQLCAEKIDAEKWLEVHEKAHLEGIRTNATMLYGHIERYSDRVDHLLRLRELQDRTKGFQAFIPLSYHPKNTETGGTVPSGIDDLKTIAISRLVLDNFQHIKAYWIMLGEKLSQTALMFGADDIEGTVMEEKITHSAGGTTSESFTVDHIRHLIKAAGKVPVERDSFYNIIG